MLTSAPHSIDKAMQAMAKMHEEGNIEKQRPQEQIRTLGSEMVQRCTKSIQSYK